VLSNEDNKVDDEMIPVRGVPSIRNDQQLTSSSKILGHNQQSYVDSEPFISQSNRDQKSIMMMK